MSAASTVHEQVPSSRVSEVKSQAFQVLEVVNNGTTLIMGDKQYKCAIGKRGLVINKTEGDGGTPIGKYQLLFGYYRKDKVNVPKTAGLNLVAMDKKDGWCDDPKSPDYNQPIRITTDYPYTYERLWRDHDDLYDVVVVISYNIDPIIAGKGSAIFFHIARDEYQATAGCVAVRKSDMLEILSQLDSNAWINIMPPR